MSELRVERKENMAGEGTRYHQAHSGREGTERKVQDVCRSYTGAGMFSWIS